MARSSDSDRISSEIKRLRKLYQGFPLEPVVWTRDGQKRSPYRTLIVMGLSTMVSDSVGINVWTKFLSRYPRPDVLRREWLVDSKNVLEIVRPLGQHDRRRKVIETAVELASNIPSRVSQLIQYPGIGATIAEKIVGYGFGKPALPLDSHGCEIIGRLCELPAPRHEDLRRKLKDIFDPSEWMEVHELLRLHGQSNGSKPETVFKLWEQWRALLIQG